MHDRPNPIDAHPIPSDSPLHPHGPGLPPTANQVVGVQEALCPPVPAGERPFDWDEELTQLLQTSAPHTASAASAPPAFPRPRSHNRRRPRRASPLKAWPWLQVISLSMATLTAFVVTAVSVLGAMVSYDPLKHLAASGVAPSLVHGWPLLVFGPWLVACLTVLRAALHRRRALHAWAVVVLFTAIAVTLSVTQAPKTLPGTAGAALPPAAALACFHQFIRQITLTRPRRALAHAAAHRAGTPSRP